MAHHKNIDAQVIGGQPPLEPGQERRWMAAEPRETCGEAMRRARREKSWGKNVVRLPTLGRNLWLFTVRVL